MVVHHRYPHNHLVVTTATAALKITQTQIISLTSQRKSTLTVLFKLVYVSVLRGDNCPAGSFDLVECHILMTLSTKAAIMVEADSFPHLNNSISEAASLVHRAGRKDD